MYSYDSREQTVQLLCEPSLINSYCTKPEVVRLVAIGYSVILYLVVYCLLAWE